MTITLTPELEAALEMEAERLGKTPQELAEETLRARLDNNVRFRDNEHPAKTLAELFEGRIGLIDSSKTTGGKPSHVAENAKEELGKILAEKHRNRAARQ